MTQESPEAQKATEQKETELKAAEQKAAEQKASPPAGGPEILPVFPLTGALLLPGGRLPLHIFEPRYRNMVEDALADQQFIGMIQPYAATPSTYCEGGDPNAENDHPDLYLVGCAGHLEQWERLPDGRFLILLRGVRRFRVRGELEPLRGYRRVEANYEEFSHDSQDTEEEVDTGRLLATLRRFGESHGLKLDWDVLGDLSGVSLLNSIAMGLPFPPEEKQALLEATGVAQRLEMLLTLLEMGLDLNPGPTAPDLN